MFKDEKKLYLDKIIAMYGWLPIVVQQNKTYMVLLKKKRNKCKGKDVYSTFGHSVHCVVLDTGRSTI